MYPKKPSVRTVRPKRFGPRQPIPDLAQAADHLWRRLYIREIDDELEKFHGFRPGGYFPINLQDELHNGQYRVIHKLGHGGYATVWLCRDQHADSPSYVAIKILIAGKSETDSCGELLLAARLTKEKEDIDKVDKVSQHFCLPLKHFMSQSPNGTHLCLVYPILGPSVQEAASIFDGEVNDIGILQEISRQTVTALATLHSCGICHGGMLYI